MDTLKSRVRAVGIDRFAGLSGHAYHAARNLKHQPNCGDTPSSHGEAPERYLLGHAGNDGISAEGGHP